MGKRDLDTLSEDEALELVNGGGAASSGEAPQTEGTRFPVYAVGPDGRPVVTIGPDGREVNEAGRRVLLAMRQGADPGVYRTATSPPFLVAVEEVGTELRIGEPWTPNRLLSALIDAARWQRIQVRETGTGEAVKVAVQVPQPPAYLLKSLSADPGRALPVLRGVVHGPYMTEDGRAVTSAGYNPATGLYLTADLRPKVAGWTASSVRALWSEWLSDFPFEGDQDYAHALALYLLPFVRALVDGPTPLHLIEAATEGSGKGKLLNTLLLPGRGRLPAVDTFPADPEEQRKALLSKLREGADLVAYDNVTGEIGGAAIEGILTTTSYAGRLLGASQVVTVENRAIWALTGNNASLSRDMVSRTLRIRLDPRCQDPTGRSDFRHPDIDGPKGWTMQRRAELAGAALWAAKEWIRAGRPEPQSAPPDSRFTPWRSVVGGILEVVGVSGFLDDRKDRAAMKAALSPAEAEWRELVALWAAKHPPVKDAERGPGGGYTVTEPVRVAALVELAKENHLLHGSRRGDEAAAVAAFGLALAKQVQRLYPLSAGSVAGAREDLALDALTPSPELGDWRIEKRVSHKSGVYVLVHRSRWPARPGGAS